jgi:pimeloyl-ACP methyl ester carboxylesterase
VVLDAGLGVPSGTWYKVQPLVAGFTQVCRYDRAGLGQSDEVATPPARTSQLLVAEMRMMLQNAGIQPPYILVGASFGGLNVQLYAIEHPQEVVGLVLVDSLHPDVDARIEQLLTPALTTQRHQDLELNQERIKFQDILDSEAQVKNAGRWPDVPLVVLRHGLPFEATSPDWPTEKVEVLWSELENDLGTRTSHSQAIPATASHHQIAESEPNLVADAIHKVWKLARPK